MNELSLFSGAGGGLLGTKLLGWRTVGYVERDEYCKRVLRARIRDGFLDDAPIWSDVRAFDGLPYRGRVDILTAGFPCQPFSVAGRRKGSDDERNCWPDTVRILREVRPPFALLENVPGLITSGYFGTILGDLAESGYDAKWMCVSAEQVGAPHRRNRLWILASDTLNGGQRMLLQPERECGSGEQADTRGNGEVRFMADSDSSRQLQPSGFGAEQRGRARDGGEEVANANEKRLQGAEFQRRDGGIVPFVSNAGWWLSEPDVGRVASGVASRVDRLKALGNGQVPICLVRAFLALTEEME